MCLAFRPQGQESTPHPPASRVSMPSSGGGTALAAPLSSPFRRTCTRSDVPSGSACSPRPRASQASASQLLNLAAVQGSPILASTAFLCDSLCIRAPLGLARAFSELHNGLRPLLSSPPSSPLSSQLSDLHHHLKPLPVTSCFLSPLSFCPGVCFSQDPNSGPGVVQLALVRKDSQAGLRGDSWLGVWVAASPPNPYASQTPVAWLGCGLGSERDRRGLTRAPSLSHSQKCRLRTQSN